MSFDIQAEYDSELFVGASITLDSTTDISALAKTAGVINISPVHALSMPDVFDTSKATWQTPNPQAVLAVTNPKNATTNSTGTSNSTSSTSAPMSANISTPQTFKGDTGFSVLSQFQADRVQATGNKGKGVKIGVIDGGVDYTLPVLGGCFGNGCKIAGGYDFVGDNYNGSNTPVPDSDPFDNCYGHGTFITGIIAAGPNEYDVPGVAPDASIYQYRVFGCNGATSDDIVIQAMIRAYQDGVDIINLSLGELSGWTEGTLSVVASRLSSRGLIVVSSAGNRGQAGSWYAFSPGSGRGVINVGSTDNTIIPSQQLYTSTGYGPITYYNYQPFTMSATQPLTPGKQYPITTYTTDPSDPNYGCTNLNRTFSGQIVIVRRGGCPLADKAQFAYEQGAIGILVVNTPATAPIQQDFPLINFAIINSDDGNYLLNQIATGANTTLSFGFYPIAVPNNYTGGALSIFSEIGPTNDLYFAPSVLIPGSNIISTIPYNPALGMFNYTIGDGTSFSCAFAAGAAALYVNAKGNNITPKKVREALESTAVQVPYSVSDSSLMSVAGQGAGKVQLYDAINSGLVISPTELTLNDTTYLNSIQFITLKNTGKSSVKYQLSHVPAGTSLTFGNSGSGPFNKQPFESPVPQVSNAASVQIFPSSITLWPGFSAIVVARITPPTGLDAAQFPVYSGWIQVSGGNNKVNVPYLGVAAAMKNMPVIDSTNFFFGMPTPFIMDGSRNVQSGPRTYTFQNGDFPTAFFRQTAGSPVVTLDLVGANAQLGFTPNYNTKRDALAAPEDEESALVGRSSVEPRTLQSSGGGSSNGGILLRWWCQVTQNQGFGCSSKTNTYSKVPIVGNLLENTYTVRE